MWQVNLRGSKPGIAELYEGHDGPVTGVHMHPHQAIGLCKLYLCLPRALISAQGYFS